MHAAIPPSRSYARIGAVLVYALAALVAVLSACGGGVGTGGTGTYAAGPITGFGSVVVNGVRFDDTAAAVVDDDGAARSRSELALGMTVEIEGGATTSNADGLAATAMRIRYGSEILGPVAAVDRNAGTVTVLGQTVRIAVETVVDERLVGGLASLAVGRIVEVYAFYDAASGSYQATRLVPVAAAAQWRLRGPVAALDSGARTLRIGGADLVYAGASGIPPALAAGQFVRLRLALAPDAGGRWQVSAFGPGVRAPADSDDARLRGRVTAIASSTSFSIDGVPIDASAADFHGGSGALHLGARAEAEGVLTGGVLRARSVGLESDDEARLRGFQLEGPIDRVDAVAQTFVVRGVTVGTARPGLRLDDGTLTDLQPGRRVEVRAELSSDRTQLEATRIRFR